MKKGKLVELIMNKCSGKKKDFINVIIGFAPRTEISETGMRISSKALGVSCNNDRLYITNCVDENDMPKRYSALDLLSDLFDYDDDCEVEILSVLSHPGNNNRFVASTTFISVIVINNVLYLYAAEEYDLSDSVSIPIISHDRSKSLLSTVTAKAKDDAHLRIKASDSRSTMIIDVTSVYITNLENQYGCSQYLILDISRSNLTAAVTLSFDVFFRDMAKVLAESNIEFVAVRLADDVYVNITDVDIHDDYVLFHVNRDMES